MEEYHWKMIFVVAGIADVSSASCRRTIGASMRCVTVHVKTLLTTEHTEHAKENLGRCFPRVLCIPWLSRLKNYFKICTRLLKSSVHNRRPGISWISEVASLMGLLASNALLRVTNTQSVREASPSLSSSVTSVVCRP